MQALVSLTSPFARKVRILLAAEQIACEIIVADPWADDPPIRTNNPLRKIPILVLDDGAFLIDSKVICEYLNAEYCQDKYLLPGTSIARAQMQNLVALADGITEAAAACVMARKVDAAWQSEIWLAWQKTKIEQALAWFEQQSVLFATEKHASRFQNLFEISLAAALSYLDFRALVDWRHTHKRLAEWLQNISQITAFQNTQPPAS